MRVREKQGVDRGNDERLEGAYNLYHKRHHAWAIFFFYKGIVARVPVPEAGSILSSGSHFVQRSETICAILVEGIIGNIHVKLF